MSKRVKVAVSVPPDHADVVRGALAHAGAGNIGEYSSCSFSWVGDGRFLPGPGSHPHIGKRGEVELVKEVRIEVICERTLARDAITAMVEAHPYEEPVYEIVQLLDLDEI